MIIDARELQPSSTIRGDVCIVGAGAAGITLAQELSDAEKEVVVLEAGGTRLDSGAQDLYKGEVLDPTRHGPLEQYRQRRFGGTTAVWGGRCAPFDEIDFEARPYVPYSGWPIKKRDLDPYYRRAHRFCELGAYAYDVPTALPHQSPEMIPGFESENVRTDRLWRFSPPTHFGKKFMDVLKRLPNVRVYLHANCLRIQGSPNGTSVDHLEVAPFESKRLTVRAQQYVLAAGGLEVTRLLLVSNDVHPNGVGNDRDLVGRFYISHLTGDLGEILFTPKSGPVVWDYERSQDAVYCRRSISIRAKRQRSDQLLNFRAILSHPPVADPRHGNGILSALYLVKRSFAHRIPPEYSKALSGMTSLQQVVGHCTNVLKDLGGLTRFSSKWIRERILSQRKLPSVLLESKSNVYTLHFDAEQSPNPESRVSLGDKRDRFGIRRLKVDWRVSDLDVQSVVRCCRLVCSAFDQSGTGKILFRPELVPDLVREKTAVGSHHIGTTRMAGAACHGVVDENCRVHGIDNLYIASSSVFPTSSFANPTLTIVALAIRLGDHLKSMSKQQTTKLTTSHVS